MPPQEVKKFVKGVKRMFANDSTTVFKGMAEVIEVSTKNGGFWNSLLNVGHMIAYGGPIVISTAMTVATYIMIRHYQRYAPTNRMREELNRIGDFMQLYNPELGLAMHRDSELGGAQGFLRRLGRGTRNMLNRLTWGVSEFTISAMDYLMQIIGPNDDLPDYLPDNALPPIEQLWHSIGRAHLARDRAIGAVQAYIDQHERLPPYPTALQ